MDLAGRKSLNETKHMQKARKCTIWADLPGRAERDGVSCPLSLSLCSQPGWIPLLSTPELPIYRTERPKGSPLTLYLTISLKG